MTHAGLMDLLHVHVRERGSGMLGVGGWVALYDVTPHPHAGWMKMEAGTLRCMSWQRNSLEEGVVSAPGI